MIWVLKTGKQITCHEKLKILEQNLNELKSLKAAYHQLILTKEYKYALEDAILLGIDEKFFIKNIAKAFSKF